jgi:glyoxylase-like metal-dependent hydrolase (beta-lactamase superfamily II)
MNRRQLLGRTAALGAGLLTTLTVGQERPAAQQPPVQPIPPPSDPRYPTPPIWERELREIAPAVYAYIQAGGPGRDNVSVSDAGVIVGDTGLLVIDTLGAPMHTKRFIEDIRRVTDKPFRQVVITHHHGDHINGNQYFEGAEFVGHPYCRAEVLKVAAAGGPAFWAKRDGWADGTEPRRIVAPTTSLDKTTTYRYGKTVVEVVPMVPAHTYGDLVVHLPQHRILFVGDIGFFYVAPFCQNANPSGWIDICNRIDRMDVRTIVPGHGPIGGKAELAEMRDYLVLLKKEARTRYDAKMTAGAAAADIRMGKYDNWIGPERIVMDTARFYDEFSGTLRPEVNTEAIRRATEEYNAARR